MTKLNLVLVLLSCALPTFATPVYSGNISSPRYTSGSTLCSGTNPVSQPSAADCAVEGSDDAILPNARLYGLVEGRLGDRGGAATYELGISNSTPSNVVNAQFDWLSNTDYNFTVTFNPLTSNLAFTLGGVSIGHIFSYNTPIVDALLLRTTSVLTGATSTVSSLSLTQNGATTNFGTAKSQATFQAPGYVDYLYLSGLDEATPWTLAGVANFTFTQTGNQSSRLAFQIKLGDDNPLFVPTADVPEPATFLAVAAGLFSLRHLSRKR